MMINNHYPYVKKGGTQGTGGTSGAAPMFACYPKIRVRNNRGEHCSLCVPRNVSCNNSAEPHYKGMFPLFPQKYTYRRIFL